MSFEQIDYRHYLEHNRLRESHRFQPIFEAVENAFNSIEERGRIEPNPPAGTVLIEIHRDERQRVTDSGDTKKQMTPPEITGISVTDNGIGFREANWQAFKTIYTSHKKLQGGKGVGRLSYLQAFREALVESRFEEEAKILCRSFTITRTPDGVSEPDLKELDSQEVSTTVSLRQFEHAYRKKAPKQLEAIARQFVVHFFQRFSVDDGIKCVIKDDWDDSEVDLQSFCRDEFMLRKKDETVSVNGHDLIVTHVSVRRGDEISGR